MFAQIVSLRQITNIIYHVGAYKYQKAPKYRKATKIPERTYKYQKARWNIGKMML